MAKKKSKKDAKSARTVRADAGAITFSGLDDPRLLEVMRHGVDGLLRIDGNKALANMALYRCITIISQCIGMLPLNLMRNDESRAMQSGHEVSQLLKRKPNGWQTAYEFKTLLQGWVLQYGNGYARIVRNGHRILQLVPMHPERVTVEQKHDWSLGYKYTRPDGGVVELAARDVFHLRDFSDDGITGVSRIKLAKKALGIAFDSEEAASRVFKDGVMAGGAVSTPNALSDIAYGRIEESLQEKHAGASKAGKFLILEEGLKAEKWANTAVDAQLLENRNHQIEEIARLFGVPRPLLMMDDTSWGSGIGELGIFFVKYGLLPWFTLWEQSLQRCLLTDTEQDELMFKFNPGALLRGSLKDQADFFSKALGAGGTQPWMTQNEVRDVSDLPQSEEATADSLKNPMTQMKQQGKQSNEPDEPTAD